MRKYRGPFIAIGGLFLLLAIEFWWFCLRELDAPVPAVTASVAEPVPSLTPEPSPDPLPTYSPREVEVEQIRSGQPALLPPPKADLQPADPHPEAKAIGGDSLTPEAEMEILQEMFTLYAETFKTLPAGEGNAQFMNALRGNNPTRWGIFPYEHSRLDSQGQLRDSWGTPYFFHQLSRTKFELRSAGPDRELFTEDDLLK